MVDNNFSVFQGVSLKVLSIEMNEFTNSCKRCSKKVQLMKSENPLCSRCQDIIEFGYPSFPAYKLQE